MKYSYMPTKEYKGKSAVDNEVDRGYGYFINSNERLLEFRNQYGETFVLVSKKRVYWLAFIGTTLGLFIGYILNK